MRTASRWTDRRLEHVIGNLLRAGVFLAALVVLAGGIIYLIHQGRLPADYRIFQGEPTDLRQIGGIFHESMALDGRGIIQFGLLLLIATPVARVAFCIFGFAAERDRMYVVFTLIVLLILLYSLVGSS
jgi:uncharacterized membrane protein